ncbi:hypothetical protein Ancab_000903 [Ancistrocladus abbreviatus]
MDTPEKTKSTATGTPISRIEDSPVFNYINNLSPIRPPYSAQSEQSFHLLSFASPQLSVASPLINCSDKSKIISTCGIPDQSKLKSYRNEGSRNHVISDVHQPAHAEVVDHLDSGDEVTVSASGELSALAKHPQSLTYVCASTANDDGGAIPELSSRATDTDTLPEKVIQGGIENQNCSFESKMLLHEIQVKQMKEAPGCEWDKFVCDTGDLLGCDSPFEQEHPKEPDDGVIDPAAASFIATVLQQPGETIDEFQKTELISVFTSDKCTLDATSTQQQGIQRQNGTGQPVVRDSSTEPYSKCTERPQMLRRRSLVFEFTGAHYRKLISDSAGSSLISERSASTVRLREKPLICGEPGSTNFSSVLPGIGLHLNALAATEDQIIAKQGPLTSERQLISTDCTISSFDSVTANAYPTNVPFTPNSMEKDNEVQITENACLDSTFGDDEGLKQGSPKKKRQKSESDGETEACKRCNCKRSKCLKLYCECFAAGLYCAEPCSCQGCFNKPVYEDTVMETRRQIESRNPLAFAPKVILVSDLLDYGDDLNKTPASARHKRGCNCKKSSCLKKYCECFQGGVGCSLSCRCEGCKNSFGRKDGIGYIVLEEAEAIEKSTKDESMQDDVPQLKEDFKEHCEVQLKPPSQMCSGSSLQPCTNKKPGKLNCVLNEPNSGTHLKMIPEDGTLNVSEEGSPCVKSLSPNCKRVSPLCHEFGSSSIWKSSRKLILKSVPSFTSPPPKSKTAELQEDLL